MTSTTQTAPAKAGGFIPVAPLRRHIQRWIESFGEDAVEDAVWHRGSSSPVKIFADRVWPGDKNNDRRLYAIMRETEWISFDLADRIVTLGLEEPWLWRSDEELAEAYQSVDLRALDARRPTCQKVADRIAAKVRRVYSEQGSIANTVAKTGVSRGRVKEIVRTPVCA